MPFAHAQRNFEEAARYGIDANLHWPGQGRAPATELVADHLLGLADEGLAGLGLRRDVRHYYLDIIEQRCRTKTNGSSWQVAVTERYEAAGASRADALRAMFGHYVENMDENTPVHTWTVPDGSAVSS